MASEYVLDPVALSVLRKGRRLTQQDLADKAKLSKRVVAECERLESQTRPRRSTIEALAKALSVKVEEFCVKAAPGPEGAGAGDSKTRTVPARGRVVVEGSVLDHANRIEATTVRISSIAKENFVVLKDKYGVTRDEVVEFAPVMFAMLAEMSLERRRRNYPKLIEYYLKNDRPDWLDSFIGDGVEASDIYSHEIFTCIENPNRAYTFRENAFGDFVSWLTKKWGLDKSIDWVKLDSNEEFLARNFDDVFEESITDPETRIPIGILKRNFKNWRDDPPVEVLPTMPRGGVGESSDLPSDSVTS